MNVLVACEFSGVVRDAFRKKGHNAWSCDILPAEDGSPWHYQDDIFNVLSFKKNIDLMIAHPPCTYLSNAGNKHKKNLDRIRPQLDAIDFFMQLAAANIPKIAIENPIGTMSTAWRKPDQIIHPWQFGHEARKPTCLWLKGLNPLVPTNIVGKGPVKVTKSGRRIPVWYNLPPGPNRAKLRSITFQGIADAMAEQWG